MNFTRYPRHWPYIQPIIVKYQFYAKRDIDEYLRSALPILLNNNSQLQQQLDAHLDIIKKKVSDVAKTKIEEIVNESEYHTINTAFFDSVRQKADLQLKNQLEKFDTKIERQRYILHLQIVVGVGCTIGILILKNYFTSL